MYRVRLPVFEGPLDALLFFVQREEVPIAQVPIARLVEQFLAYLRWVEVVDLEAAAEFFAVAVELLAIKARWLLRRPGEAEEAEGEGLTIGDAPEPLWERLQEYRRYKYAAAFLRQRLQSPAVFRGAALVWQRVAEGSGWENATVAALVEALQRMVHRQGRVLVAPLPSELSVAEYMGEVLAMVRRRGVVLFSGLLEGRSRGEAVAFFLAVLELVRQGQLGMEQEELFGEIRLWDSSEQYAHEAALF
jgi:segregation and condensation protein A